MSQTEQRRGLVRPFAATGRLLPWLAAFLLIVCHGVPGTADPPTDSFQAYRLTVAAPARVAAQLKELLATLPDRSEVVVDAIGNRILVRGTAQAQALTARFLRIVDRSAPPRPPSQPALQAYRIGPQAPAVAARLARELAGRQDVRVTGDKRTGQLLVVAPADVQADIARRVGGRGETVADGASTAPPPGTGNATRQAKQSTAVGDLPVGRSAGSSRIPSASRGAPAGVARLPAARPNQAKPVASSRQPPHRTDPHGSPATTDRMAEAPRLTVPAPAARRKQVQAAPPGTNQVPATLTLPLRHIGWEAMHEKLQRLLGHPVPTTRQRSDRGDTVRLELPATSGTPVDVQIQPGTGRMVLRGPALAVRSWARAMAAIDVPAAPTGRRTELVAVKTSCPEQLHRALSAIQADGAARRGPAHRMAAMLFQPNAKKVSAGAKATGAGAPAKTTATPAPEPISAGAIGPVDIEFLEGSDVIVLRGREQDVARVRQLIEQIEQLSRETEPVVMVHSLQHVGSEAIGKLLSDLYTEVFLARQGAVSITPLVTPNALLLVGREENVKTVLKLLEKLDQPVAASSQFQIYRLKHASAVEAKATIDEFLDKQANEQPAGLAVRGRVTADFRSNSLIVQAGPRDLAQIAALVARIDTATSDAVNELKIFPLRNALAEDLVATLRYAIEQQGQSGTAPTAPTRARRPAQNPRPAGQTGQPSTRSTALKFLTIDNQGGRQLRSGILTDVRITADTRANAVVVSAPAESMELIAALVGALDRMPAPEAQIKVFTIVNGDASNLIQVLEQLFGAQQQQQRRAGGVTGVSAAVGGAGNPLITMRFSVDERTNSIIASGSTDDLAVVEAILLRLDESDIRQRKTKVYRLKNAWAESVSEAVNNWLRTERERRELTPGVVSPFEQIEREVVVVPEVVSNTLIVSATPKYYEEIRSLVEQLDERPPMVMIQVLIAEVGLRDVDEFGVELGLQDSLLFDRSILQSIETITTSFASQDQGSVNTVTQDTIVNAPLVPGFNFNNGNPLGNNGSDRALSNSSKVGGQALSNFAVGRMNGELGYGGLVLAAGSESVNVLLRALQDSRRLEILSRPQIMTLDNQPAYIQVGQEVPRIVGTSVDLGVQQNRIEDTPVGIILQVQPRISPDDLVVMQVDATKSQVGPEAEGIPISVNAVGDVIRSPRIDQTFAQTVVAAASGQTIVLGGLITKRTEDSHRRVPFLSNIPVLGHLFRYDMTSEQRTELLIILTPHVIRSQADAERVKRVEAARMNWCLSDVVKMQGPLGIRGRGAAWGDNETTTVYPGPGEGGAEPVPAPTGNMLRSDVPAREAMPLGNPSPQPKIAPTPGTAAPESTGQPTTGRHSSRRRQDTTAGHVKPAAYGQPASTPATARRAPIHLPAVGNLPPARTAGAGNH